MADAVKTPNVIEATNKPGLYNKLEALQKRWGLSHLDEASWRSLHRPV